MAFTVSKNSSGATAARVQVSQHLTLLILTIELVQKGHTVSDK